MLQIGSNFSYLHQTLAIEEDRQACFAGFSASLSDGFFRRRVCSCHAIPLEIH